MSRCALGALLGSLAAGACSGESSVEDDGGKPAGGGATGGVAQTGGSAGVAGVGAVAGEGEGEGGTAGKGGSAGANAGGEGGDDTAGAGMAGDGAGGTGGATGTCGNAALESGEECESPVSASPFRGDGTCSDDCQVAASASCLACENDEGCGELVMGCRDFPTAVGRTACYDLLECFRDNPTCGAVIPEPCYCGALDTTTCAARSPYPSPDAPDGPCAREFEAAMGSTSPATVLVNFSNINVPGSYATQRLLCDEAFCPTPCF